METLNTVLWLAAIAQLAWLPIRASALGRSGALWFLLGLLWSGGAPLLYVLTAFGPIGTAVLLGALVPSMVLEAAGRARGPRGLRRSRTRRRARSARSRSHTLAHAR